MAATDEGPVRLRPDLEPEHSTPYVGMMIFLGSWTILFAGLFFMFAAYRIREPVWPPDGLPRLPLLLPTINTLVIAASSVLLHRGERRLRAGHRQAFRRSLVGALVLAAVFVVLQVLLWIDVVDVGLGVRSGLYASYFWALTVFHALHVLAGLVVLAWLIPLTTRSSVPGHGVRVKVAGMFWHFVGAVWLVLYLLVFLT